MEVPALCSQKFEGSGEEVDVMLPLPTMAICTSRHKLLDCSPTSRVQQLGLGLENRLLLAF